VLNYETVSQVQFANLSCNVVASSQAVNAFMSRSSS
jgi:hypothetical protein